MKDGRPGGVFVAIRWGRCFDAANIALGKVLLAISRLASELDDLKPLVRFFRDVRTNLRPATRMKAEQFLKELGAVGG